MATVKFSDDSLSYCITMYYIQTDGIDEILYEYKILQRNHFLFTNALLVHLYVSLEACKLQNILPIFFLQVT